MNGNKGESKVEHRNQYVDFRVMVYRLNIQGEANTSLGPAFSPFSIDDLFAYDFSDNETFSILEEMSNDRGKAFALFLSDYYTALKAALYDSDGTPKSIDALSKLPSKGQSSQSVFQEVDITPLVNSVTTNLSLDGINSCSISAYDPRQADAKIKEYERRHRSDHGFRKNTINMSSNAKAVRGFKFREFDLIRVYTHSRVGTSESASPESHRVDLQSSMGDNGPVLFPLTPSFTGIIETIVTSSTAGQMSMIEVGCKGIMKMFANSVTVFNQALANVVTNDAPELNTFGGINVMENRFSNKRGDDILKSIFSDYLHPQWLPTRTLVNTGSGRDESAGRNTVAVPSMDTIFVALNETVKNEKTGESVNKIIPMIRTVILLHLLKIRHREALFTFDDRLSLNGDPRGALVEVVSEGDPKGRKTIYPDSIMDPYLDMFRSSYENYNSSYKPASQIFDDIRKTTFMEIFEDRQGGFHFRFPRYNDVRILNVIDASETTSVSVTSDDSAIYNTVVAQSALKFMGEQKIIPGEVFMDRFSILKIGFRAPEVIVNPNANGDFSSSELATFSRKYYSMRDARTADITRLGDPLLDVGVLVHFNIGRTSSPESESNSLDEMDMSKVGYVTSISETMSVSGTYTQRISLQFVRDGDIDPDKYLDRVDSIVTGDLWDMANVGATPSVGDNKNEEISFALAESTLSRRSIINSLTSNSSIPLSQSQWIFPVKLKQGVAALSDFEPAPSVEDLAGRLNTAKVNDEVRRAAIARRNSRDLVMDINKSIKAKDQEIANEKTAVAGSQRRRKILDFFSAELSETIIAFRSGSFGSSTQGKPVYGFYEGKLKRALKDAYIDATGDSTGTLSALVGRSPETITFRENGAPASDEVLVPNSSSYIYLRSLLRDTWRSNKGKRDAYLSDWKRIFQDNAAFSIGAASPDRQALELLLLLETEVRKSISKSTQESNGSIVSLKLLDKADLVKQLEAAKISSTEAKKQLIAQRKKAAATLRGPSNLKR